MEKGQVSIEMWIALGVLLALFFGVVVVAIRFSLRQHQKIVAQFRRMAEKYDLELTIPPATMMGLYRRNPTLYGRYRGHEMSIFPKGYGMDNTRQTDTAVRITTRADAKLRISLTRRSLTGKLGQFGRLKEVSTGDAAFDQGFSLRSNDAAAALQIFNAPQRARVTRDWPQTDNFFSLEDSVITHLRFGLTYDDAAREEVEQIVNFCLDLSDSI